MKQQTYAQELELAIDTYLMNITELQSKLMKEEAALQASLKKLNDYERAQKCQTSAAYALA